MAFGFEAQGRIFLGDTKPITAFLYAEDDTTLIPQGSISSVVFTVVTPTDDPSSPTINAVAGTVSADGTGIYKIPGTVNATAGHYHVVAKFTYSEGAFTGLTKSVTQDYEVVDPFERTGASPADGAIRQAWLKLEDCFDSELGGPWLRDMTKARFDQSKMRGLLPEVFLEINAQMPQTDYTETSFPYAANDGEALLAEGLLVASMRHLMRSYTEQPNMTNSPAGWMDRTRYQQAWNQMYQVEKPHWDNLLYYYKARLFDLTSAKILVGSKAGRMLPGPMRSRNVWRGY